MASSLIGQLRILLGLETGQLETGARRAKKELGGIKQAAGEVRQAMRDLMAIFAFEALKETVKRSLEHVAALGEQARALGISTKELQEYRYAAGQAGMSIEQTDKFLGKLSKSLGDARNGQQESLKAWQALSKVLGVDILKSTKNVGDAIPLLSEGLKKIEDPTKRNSLSAVLLSRAWREAAPFLALGAEKIDQLRQAANDLGIVLSEQQIQNAEETAHKLKSLHDVLGARIDGAVAANAQSILGLADSFTRLAIGIAKFWSQNPTRAMGLLGAAAGASFGSRFGLPGAAIGAGAGYLGGTMVAPDTPQSLREQAQYFLNNAHRNAAGRGYYNPGTSVDRKKQILAAGEVRSNLDRAKQFLSRATEMERSAPLAAPDAPGTGDIPQFLKGGGHKRHPADHTEQREKEAERLKYELDRAELDSQRQLLQAQQSLTIDTEDRNDLALQMLQVDHDQKALEIDHNLKMVELDKTISADKKREAEASAAKQRTLNDQLLILSRQSANLQTELAREKEYDQTEQTVFAGRRDRLQIEADLAQTASERRKVELELLDLAYEERKQALRRVLDDTFTYTDEKGQSHTEYTHTADDRNRAQIELGTLDATRSGEREKVMRDTMGPLESYLHSLPDTAAKINEAFQELAVEGIHDVNDGLTQMIAGFFHLGKVGDAVLSKIISLLLEMAEAKLMGNSGGGGFGGLLGSLLGSGGGLTSVGPSFAGATAPGGFTPDVASLVQAIPHFASGGSLTIGGMAGVDKNTLSLNGAAIARVSRGEKLAITPANNGGRGPVQEVVIRAHPSEMLLLEIDRRSAKVVGSAAPGIVSAAVKATSKAFSRPRIG
jgi:hypothetical protein